MKNQFFKIVLFVLFFIVQFSCVQTTTEGPYLGTGIKIGEVSQTEAIVWVRLTENPERVGNEALMPDVKYKDPETGKLVERQGRPDKTPVVTYPTGYSGSLSRQRRESTYKI